MGIEPTGKAPPELENKRFRTNADATCDARLLEKYAIRPEDPED